LFFRQTQNFLRNNVNEAMNVEASAAPEKWEKLLSHIQKCADTYASALVELTDSKADCYDFANEVLMSRMQERLLATLQRATQSDTFLHDNE
jgi:hypothetical protein